MVQFSLFCLWLLAPAGIIAVVNFNRASQGRGFEPLVDNAIMYAVILATLVPATIATGVLVSRRGLRTPVLIDILHYAALAAVASGAFMTLLDAMEGYFSGPGIGWGFPLRGLVLGLGFGAVARIVFRSPNGVPALATEPRIRSARALSSALRAAAAPRP